MTCDSSEHSIVVQAPDRTKAKQWACFDLCGCNRPFIDHGVRRGKEFDGRTDLTELVLVCEYGWWHECGGCHRTVHDHDFLGEGVAVSDDQGRVYCKPACREKHKGAA